MEANFFIGRFHVALVHLPIGFLLLAVAMHFIALRNQTRNLEQAIAVSLSLGLASAAVATVCGWLLAGNGGYEEVILYYHRWLGIAIVFLSGFCWLAARGNIRTGKRTLSLSMILLASAIIYTGHLGGKLTHGEGYLLRYAPGVLQSVFGYNPQPITENQRFLNPDSTFVFNDLLLPALTEKCGDCHSDKNKKGGLVLTTKEGFIKGGEHDEIFVAGNATESEIFIRVTLGAKDEKYMPPKGEVLSYDQIRLLEWWINNGADFEKTVSSYEIPADIGRLLKRNFGMESGKKSFVETFKVVPLPDSVFNKLEEQGFNATPLAANNNLLEISLKPGVKNVAPDQVKMLTNAKDQLTWLNLGNKNITDEHLSEIKKLTNLTRLRLEQTLVTDAGLAQLTQLTHLESLNLYGTAVTDQSIESILNMPALKKIYLWQTNFSLEGLERLKNQRPDLEIINGITLSDGK